MGETIATSIRSKKTRLQVLKLFQDFMDGFLEPRSQLVERIHMIQQQKRKKVELKELQEKYCALVEADDIKWGLKGLVYKWPRSDYVEELNSSGFLYIAPFTNDNIELDGWSSYINLPTAIGFNYGDHSLAWALTRWIAERFGNGKLYSSHEPGSGVMEPHEPAPETAAWLIWVRPFFDDLAIKAGLNPKVN